MTDLDFTDDEVLSQAKGNGTAIFHMAVRWAKQQSGSVDGWATFVGEEFAPGWDELGDNPSALRVARISGLNMATTADMAPVDVSGDDTRAVLTLEGPEQTWLEDMGTTIEDIDRTNELIFRAIAERRGLTLTADRSGSTLRLTFARKDQM